MELLLGPGVLMPSLGEGPRAFVRIGYGVLLLATLVRLLPDARRFFLGERWGGYGERGWRVDLIQNPIVAPIVLSLWMASAALLIVNVWTVPAAAFALACGHYFFVGMRWRSVARGMGAPGFITFWLGVAVFLLEYTARHAPALGGLALLVLQVDFALVMIAAGIYKFTAGYRQNQGMELGMVNPEWGYWPRFWQRVRPSHPLFRFFNEMAWATEVVAGVLMLVPATRFIGAALILLSFVFIRTQIRLGFLAEMVMTCGVLFFHPGSAGDQLLQALAPPSAIGVDPGPVMLNRGLELALWGYLLVLPLARLGLSYNLYWKRALPGAAQSLLDGFANTVGLILWRVFSADICNFFIQIDQQQRDGTGRTPIARWGASRRFRQVEEAITVTTLFTTLKYYPSNRSIFENRLIRYARTVPRDRDCLLVFEYVSVIKESEGFAFRPVAEFVVDPDTRSVTETTLDASLSLRSGVAVSPIHEAVRPGSYVPLKS